MILPQEILVCLKYVQIESEASFYRDNGIKVAMKKMKPEAI